MKKWGLVLLLVTLPLLLGGCNWSEVRDARRTLGGEVYDIDIVTSPLGADVEIDKQYKGVTPLRVSYITPQYTEVFWERVVVTGSGVVLERIPLSREEAESIKVLLSESARRSLTLPQYIGREEYEQFFEQKRVLSIGKEGYEDVVIAFSLRDVERKIPEVIQLVKTRTYFPEEGRREQPAAPQQQQMMGPTIIIGGRTVTGEEAVKIVNYGMVKFDSIPQGAEVLIEGNLIGYTPTAYLKFQVGTYNVEIVKAGYQPWERKVMVIQDSSIVINPQLEQEES